MVYDSQNNLYLMRKTFKKLPVSHSTVKTTFDILMNILPDFFQLIYV